MLKPVLVLICLLAAGCTAPEPDAPSLPFFEVNSSDFIHGKTMPERLTCDGAGQMPSLFWNSHPAGTAHFALLVEDLDADFTHWMWWNLDARNTASSGERSDLPRGQNDGGGLDYVAPCPPVGDGVHRYIFHVIALDAPLDLADGSSRAQFDAAIAKHAVANGLLRGLYERGE